MGVLPRAVREAVRVERRDEPEILPRVHPAERRDDGETGAFVAVDTTDDEHAGARTGDVHQLDRPVLNRITEDSTYR